jgi:NitT/TauT family transport system substrate-binding protein
MIPRRLIVAAVAALACVASFARAQPVNKVQLRGSLDFVRYGANAPYDHAAAQGYFAQYGLEVAFDAAKGSQDSVARVASGVYDFGVADFPTLVQFVALHPDGPKAVFIVIDESPLSVVSLKTANIRKPADLVGRTLAMAETEGGSRLFPAFMKANGLSDTQVERKIIDVRLRDTMLLRGGVDAVIGNNYTVLFNLKGLGVPPENLSFLNYAENGLDLYGQGVIVRRALIEQNPEAVRGIVRAAARAWREAVVDTRPAIQSIFKMDGTLNVDLEAERLRWFIDHTVVTPNTRRNGIGSYDPVRLKHNVEIVSTGLALPRTPDVAEVFDERFLPPPGERTLPAGK